MRVVIVGAAGFIGRAVADAMEGADIDVRLCDAPARLARDPDWARRKQVHEFDFSMEAAPAALLEKVDTLVHLGCTTNPSRSMQAMSFDADSNIGPSIRLFEAASRAGIRRVVFSSSGGTVYGAPACIPVGEEAPTDPISAYGVSKLAIEKYLAICPGIEGVSLRIANPYGAGQLQGAAVGVIARYLAAVIQGEALEVWGDGSVVRDYVAIEDVGRAFVAALGLAAPGKYNIGSGEGASINEIIQMIFEVSGRHVPVQYKAPRGYDVPTVVLDSTRFSVGTGWRPQVCLAEGIERLYRVAMGGRSDRVGVPG